MKIIGAVILALSAASGWAGDAGNGKAVFSAKCGSCHDKDGKGNPAMAKMFKAEPAALDLSDEGTQGKTHEEIIGLISQGKNKMPSFTGKLKDGEIDDAAAYIHSLGGKPAVDTAAAAKLFAGKCGSCHGKDGKGNPATAKMSKGAPAALDLSDEGTQDKTDEELIGLTSQGKNKMPAFTGKLSAPEIKALVAYLRSLGPAKK